MAADGATAKIAELPRRGVVAISGPDAETLLDDLFTTNLPKDSGAASYGGLLTPQGKLLFDFLAFVNDGTYLFDLPREATAAFAKRIAFYRLRAKVEISEAPDMRVVAGWDGAVFDGTSAPDPRFADLGQRAIVTGPVETNATEADYDAHRIALGVPEGGIDFAYGDTFPHDIDMDQLAGIDFKKGCYVGQEVVSRMEHRGTARRRFAVVRGTPPLPAPGTEITASGKTLGTLGSSAGGDALALLRLDRTKDAVDAGTTILAGDVPVTPALPAWARFTWPTPAAED
jgi:hypothetical protein